MLAHGAQHVSIVAAGDEQSAPRRRDVRLRSRGPMLGHEAGAEGACFAFQTHLQVQSRQQLRTFLLNRLQLIGIESERG